MHRQLYYRDNPLGTKPEQHYEVHCGQCQWRGMIDQMKTIYNPNPSKPGDVIPEPGCPMCLSDQQLEYMENDNIIKALHNLTEKRELLFAALVKVGKDTARWPKSQSQK